MRVAAPSLIGLVLLGACGADDGPEGGGADGGVDGHDEVFPPIPLETIPCEEPGYWPLALRSPTHPAIVHYRGPAEEAMAREVLALLDRSWDVEVGRLGFRPPLDDGGACGDDGAFDVFVWRGSDGCYVDVIDEVAGTAHDDRLAYLVVDPWGPYGGPILDTTIAHELNHAMQAADDWSDAALIYEATSVLVEDEVFDDDGQYVDQIVDFQAHPDWSLDRDDDYQTWYMYGAALYLRYLRDRHWGGDAAFVGELWRRLRSPAAADEPDFEDALEVMLRARTGLGFLDSVTGFARWRYYTGARADAAHLEEAAAFAEPARAGSARTSGARIALQPMLLGSAYVDLVRQAGDPARVAISLDGADAAVRWVVQVVPGATSDGDLLDLSAGPRTIDVPAARTIVVTALPRGADDVDDRTDDRFPATLVIAAR
jgi:hypothetical protein